MFSKWLANSSGSEIVPANNYRGKITIQLQGGDTVALGFGVPADFDNGIKLYSPGDSITIVEEFSREAIYAICDNGKSSSGVYHEGMLHINLRGAQGAGY